MLLAVAERAADHSQQGGTQQRAVVVGDIPLAPVQRVVVIVLTGVGEQGKEQDDVPRELYPQHEQRQGRQRAVDGVVARQEDLAIHVGTLQQVDEDGGEQCGNDGVP